MLLTRRCARPVSSIAPCAARGKYFLRHGVNVLVVDADMDAEKGLALVTAAMQNLSYWPRPSGPVQVVQTAGQKEAVKVRVRDSAVEKL